MNDYFLRLFRFTNWANQVVTTYLVAHPIEDDNCTQLISHLWHAQLNWYNRIRLQQQDQPVWQPVKIDKLPTLLDANGTEWLDYIQSLTENQLAQPIAYLNLAGQPMQNTVQDILAHVVNHGTYHRGQLVRRIRELGYVPPSTDFIIYARLNP